ncbi:hypothetical protein BXZ70DRAFT_1006415 [Cristinia sonorae]|uniref:Uncharacterized protein n=1 Tax=Cristinia sonorae TaxID=1940300 RepID=A0A8K0XRP3_9AGAR|nr:hypothetical protein BXZ70DRAFT_1006415 [Cristinia sonorae]
MSVYLLRRSLQIQQRCVPLLRTSIHRLYSLQTEPAEPTNAPAETSTSHDQSATESKHQYIPPRLYSAPTVKPFSRRKRQKAGANSSQIENSTQNELKPKKIVKREPVASVESHLAALNAAGVIPSLEDLERFRSKQPPAADSPKYPKAYSELVDNLCRSFSKEQLKSFVGTYAPNSPMSRFGRRKMDYAESIVEHWGWPSLKEVERNRRDRTEVSQQTFPVSSAELFLILGRDGSDLLELSREFNVHIALQQQPMALRVEGVRNSLRGITERIHSLKRDILTKTVCLPNNTSIPDNLMQRISRTVDAYVQNIPNSPSRIHVASLGNANMERTERLLIRAAHQIHLSSIAPQLSYTPATPDITSSFTHRYALYPHYPERSRPLDLHSARTFRLRKVAGGLALPRNDYIRHADGPGSSHGTIITHSGSPIDLRQLFLDKPLLKEGNRTVKASFGHMLFNDIDSKNGSLLSPLSRYQNYSTIQDWIVQNSVRTSFLPSLPHSLTHSLPSEQRVLHRLCYSSVPPNAQDFQIPTVHNMTFEITLSGSSSAAGCEKNTLPSAPRVHRGIQRQVDVMQPDRSMDIRFTVTDLVAIGQEKWPSALRAYAEDLLNFVGGRQNAAQPDPPVLLKYEGVEYILQDMLSVRHSTEAPPLEQESSGASAQVITESILDLENGQKFAQCEVIYDNALRDGWIHFLHVCDKLSSSSYGIKSPLGLAIPSA